MNGQTLKFGIITPTFGDRQTTEPFGFDGSPFTLEQEKGRYGRDVTYGADKINLRFEHGFFEKSEMVQQLPDGTLSEYLTMGLPYIFAELSLTGFETVIMFYVEFNGDRMILGQLDFTTYKSDKKTYLECQIIQDTDRAKLKRQEETKVDVFSSLDIDGNPITPLTTTKVLLKAVPLPQTSVWIQGSAYTAKAGLTRYINKASGLQGYGVEDSYTPFFDRMSGLGEDITDATNNFRYNLAANNLSEVEWKFEQDIDFLYRVTGGDSGTSASIKLIYNTYQYPYTVDSPDSTMILYEKIITGTADVDFKLPPEFTLSLPVIPRDYSFSVFWALEWDTANLGDGEARTRWVFNSSKMTEVANSTGIDTVVSAVPYISLFEQNVKSVTGGQVFAHRYQGNGEFSMRYAFNGFLIRQFTDKPFYVTWKDLAGYLQETNSDYQTLPGGDVYISIERDFYPNKEIAAYSQQPDIDFEVEPNQRLLIKLLEWQFANYKKADTNGVSEDGLGAIHTEAQYKMTNQIANGKLSIKVDIITDPLKIEELKRRVIQDYANDSTNDDDNIAVMDMIQLAPGTVGGFPAKLLQRQTEEGDLQILNSSDEESGNFTWDTLGIKVGDVITIGLGQNAGSYTILNIEPTIITLSGSPAVDNVSEIISISYILTDVLLTNRTSEGFIQTDLPKFGNQRYTIGRLLRNYFGETLKAINKWHPNGFISVRGFKGFGDFTSQYMGEDEPITENANILIAELPDAILDTDTVGTRLNLSFAQAKYLYNAYNVINDDGTIGGFVRVNGTQGDQIKGYPTNAPWLLTEGVVTANLEVKQESEYLTITSVSGYIIINEVRYPILQIGDWYPDFSGDFVTIREGSSSPLTQPTHYSKVSVNGNIYDSSVNLSGALLDIQN